MKNALVLILCLTVLISCKNDSKSTAETTSTNQADTTEIIKGEFVYFEDAAVLQTTKEVYGVVINDNMHELNKQAKAYKTEATDMVPVEIKGIIRAKPNSEEGWPFRVEIIEIINVSQPLAQNENTIKIKNTNN
ncbi:conserved hypothetical protein [Formosa agariphila KMM 3901]|uniref:NlpE C-terminal OB domain-containing protein n=1 Tax=Formosa agariphila (strain DSM 15362 / KCTC 12365 / LMG 23005 / KMM 3901 / M-2Alg 35-1) TaxID=1347342 RepID=T2KS74_FORAG|nr:hypothetical protein [Formosa agariphila]CDF80994.1 conserved hypothetical protein [Formosa agariphila KMM 3901]